MDYSLKIIVQEFFLNTHYRVFNRFSYEFNTETKSYKPQRTNMKNLITKCTPSSVNGKMEISTLANKSTLLNLQEHLPKNKLVEM